GDVVVEGRLTPERVGVCASIGALDVTVRRRPRVAVFATGTELNQAPGRHEIRNSNGPMLCALLAGAGYDVLDLDSVGDDRALLDAAFERALDAADVVVTTGGVSKGEHDLVRPALEAGGVEIAVHGVSLQPGKPLLFGRRGDRACFGLPGNPASSLVCADVFLLPYLAALAGRDPNDALVESRARVSAPVQASRKRRRVFPCRRSPDGVDPLPWRSSADLYMLTRGNGYVVIAAGADLAAGDEALVWIPERFGAA
ncbi:MAG: molybdopterin molybdotransferase MoeA, partial [Planctomycetota bacterium]|nr:molybdopterin molybdotransferase MoeA [Planctomycetota bacterium]